MTLGELIDGLDVRVYGDAHARNTRVCDITEDSRTAMPGSLFIAKAGTKTDGRKFVASALDAGAEVVLTATPPDPDVLRLLESRGSVCVAAGDVALAGAQIAERIHGRPTSKLKLVGITGTNGKTTTAHGVHRLLNASKMRCGLIGTVLIDDGREVAEASMTTPPACELSATFAGMLEAGCVAAAMEVSSHALDQRRVGALDFDVAVFTNLTGDHLDYHGTMERYSAAKAMLFEMLRADAAAVVNADDPGHARMVQKCRARVLRCSMERGDAECRVSAGVPTFDGTRARYTGPWGEFEILLGMVGRHNLMNSLQAVAAAHLVGLPVDQIARAATLMEAPPGRLERVTAPGVQHPFAVFVDYAHTDDALANVLRAARPLVTTAGAKLRVVFGCGGDRDRTKRPRMAKTCCDLADAVTVTSDNPRTEQPSAIIDEVLTGVPESARGRVEVHADRRTAIFRAVESCGVGDVLVIAGKGHETYQLLPDGAGGIRRIDFDDRLVAREAMGACVHA